MSATTYNFKAEVWLYPSMAGWHFITIPAEISKKIDFKHGMEKRGWGSLPVSVTIGGTTWSTSIFPDKKSQSYVLPVKAVVRKKESISKGNFVAVALQIQE